MVNPISRSTVHMLIFLAAIWLSACSDNKPPFTVPGSQSTEENKFTNIGRSSWQKPHLVIEKLGDISDKTIADIGAGTGYFTFRMAFKAKKIIATDIDTNMIAIINEFAVNLPPEIQSKIETRLVKPNDPMLQKGECDVAVLINTLAYIQDKEAYLKKLHAILNPGDTLMVVDFKSASISGIAQNYKIIEAARVEEYLKKAGFTSSTIDNKTLDYQYIILAKA